MNTRTYSRVRRVDMVVYNLFCLGWNVHATWVSSTSWGFIGKRASQWLQVWIGVHPVGSTEELDVHAVSLPVGFWKASCTGIVYSLSSSLPGGQTRKWETATLLIDLFCSTFFSPFFGREGGTCVCLSQRTSFPISPSNMWVPEDNLKLLSLVAGAFIGWTNSLALMDFWGGRVQIHRASYTKDTVMRRAFSKCWGRSRGGSYCPPTSLAYRETNSFNLCLCMGTCTCAWVSWGTALDDCCSLGTTHLYFFLGAFAVDLRSYQHFMNRTISLAPPIISEVSEFHPIFVSAPASWLFNAFQITC